jgi:hypothetical protein
VYGRRQSYRSGNCDGIVYAVFKNVHMRKGKTEEIVECEM